MSKFNPLPRSITSLDAVLSGTSQLSTNYGVREFGSKIVNEKFRLRISRQAFPRDTQTAMVQSWWVRRTNKYCPSPALANENLRASIKPCAASLKISLNFPNTTIAGEYIQKNSHRFGEKGLWKWSEILVFFQHSLRTGILQSIRCIQPIERNNTGKRIYTSDWLRIATIYRDHLPGKWPTYVPILQI